MKTTRYIIFGKYEELTKLTNLLKELEIESTSKIDEFGLFVTFINVNPTQLKYIKYIKNNYKLKINIRKLVIH